MKTKIDLMLKKLSGEKIHVNMEGIITCEHPCANCGGNLAIATNYNCCTYGGEHIHLCDECLEYLRC